MNRLLVAAAFAALPMVAVLTGCPGETAAEPEITDPSQLKAPLKGEGFQFRTELFSVAPGEEIQDCYFYKVSDLAKAGGLPENEPVNLHRVQMVQKDGSHHMNIFRVRTIKALGPEGGAIQRGKNGQGESSASRARTGRTGRSSRTRRRTVRSTGRSPTASRTCSSPTSGSCCRPITSMPARRRRRTRRRSPSTSTR
jgi:hypothetical protein